MARNATHKPIAKAPLSSDGLPTTLNQRQKDQDNPERCHVPYKGAQQKNPRCVQGEIDNTSPKIELSTPLGHPAVCGSHMRCEDCCSEQRKRLDEIVQCPF